MRDVPLSGGVLDGLSFTVGDDGEAIVHHAVHVGTYLLIGVLGVWTPEVVETDAPIVVNS